jgi:Mrp family chromosome partitioning ATPase
MSGGDSSCGIVRSAADHENVPDSRAGYFPQYRANRFGLIPDDGLSQHLSAGTPLKTFRLEGENLTVIPTSGGMVHSAELLASGRAQALFAAMRDSDRSNVFICDLPPVFANDDAVASMAHLSGYILVSEEGRTTEREIKDAVMALGRDRLAGVVLNKFRGGVVSDGYGVDSYYAEGYGVDVNTSKTNAD